jgi:hypothetical protein
MAETTWRINPLEYLEAPGLSALVFHNIYSEGKQGGLEIIQHGERVATNGDLRLEPTPGQWAPLPKLERREVDAEQGEARVFLHYPILELDYIIRVRAEGPALRVLVDLAQPLRVEWEGLAGFNLELYPPAYFGKTFFLGETCGIFPRQANGPMAAASAEGIHPLPLAVGQKLSIAPEDPLRRMEIETAHGTLALYDGRTTAQNGWFVVRALIPAGRAQAAIEWTITPHAVPGWQRAPVICLSQVGYHPDQVKRAVIELESGLEGTDLAVLERIDPAGQFHQAHAARPEPWGHFLRYDYTVFDFSSVQAPGMYRVGYGGQVTPPFKIGSDVYQSGVWQPTLETFLPVQMCHVEVRDRHQVWHGACHLDDALQAPPDTNHFDGYAQGAGTDTAFPPLTHIPFLDRGGWHDAGDFDLAAGSQAHTTFILALAREAFGVDTDQTAVDPHLRAVQLHVPDGLPDIVQQIAHGAENLLSGYRAAGHSLAGIIESTLYPQYVHQGDASTVTDNRVYDPALWLEETALEPGSGGLRSGKMDDRWAFTNRDSSLEYRVLAALAAASRTLRGIQRAPAATEPARTAENIDTPAASACVARTGSPSYPNPAGEFDELAAADRLPAGEFDELAAECLQTALRAWEWEQTHAPVAQGSAYVPGQVEVQEVLAAAELLITTGEERFRRRLLDLWPVIEANIHRLGWCAARLLPHIGDGAFRARLQAALEAGKEKLESGLAANPFGVPWRPHIWGLGWNLQQFAVERYYLVQAFPELFNREDILRVVNYVLGCHPGSNTSFVSGIGARSITAAYGTNRADWSYIPGGNVSGTALVRPDFPELKEPFPFLWQQTEYVIGGAATYIFCVLAADRLLNVGNLLP